MAWILLKCYIWVFFENLSRRFKFDWNLTRISATVCEDRWAFVVISSRMFPGMRNVLDCSFK
jgi:hypothetical protein